MHILNLSNTHAHTHTHTYIYKMHSPLDMAQRLINLAEQTHKRQLRERERDLHERQRELWEQSLTSDQLAATQAAEQDNDW